MFTKKYQQEVTLLIQQHQYNKALLLLEKLHANYLQQGMAKSLEVAYIFKQNAAIHTFENQFQKALEYEKKAYQIKLELLGEEHKDTIDSYGGIGARLIRVGEYELALEYLNNTLKRYEGLPNTVLDQYSINIHIAFCYQHTNDYWNAILHYQKVLSLAKKNGQTPFLGVYIGLGVCYSRMGNAMRSLYYCKQGLKNETTFHENAINIPIVYLKMGEEYTILGNYPSALSAYQKASQIFINSSGELSFDTSHAYEGLGKLHLAMKDFEQAHTNFQKALSIRLKTMGNYGLHVANIYLRLLQLFCEEGNYPNALQNAQAGLQALTKRDLGKTPYKNPPLKTIKDHTGMLILAYKALAFHQYYLQNPSLSQNLQAALDTLGLAIQLIDQMRKSYYSDSSKLALTQQSILTYRIGMNIAHTIWQKNKVQQGIEKAFDFAEKAKANLLLSALQENFAKTTTSIPDSLVQKEKVLKTQLTQLDKAIQVKETELFSTKHPASKEEEIRSQQLEFFKHQQVYLQFIQQLEKDYPNYYQLKYETKTVTLPQIQFLLQPSELLIQYSLYEETLFIFAIRPKMVSFQKILLSDHLAQKIDALEKAIFLSDLEEYTRLASELYVLVLSPIEGFLVDVNKLIIIPDGVLHRLSFDTLIPPSNSPVSTFSELPYLIKTFDIQYHYSATLIQHAHQKRVQKTVSAKDGFLGLAPIQFEQSGRGTGGYILKSNGKKREWILKSGGNEADALQDLTATEVEVKRVYELFETQQKEAIALFYDMASKENLLAHIEEYKYILLSTHGFSNTEHSALSGLNLYSAPNKKDSLSETDHVLTDKTKFYISDVMNLQLKAELVVLSSCESGVGKLEVGEGVMALHRAFLYAGAQNIVYSLFKVPQDSTSELIQTFFRYALEGDTYSTALRKAKLEMIQDESMEPIDWAGFALIGG